MDVALVVEWQTGVGGGGSAGGSAGGNGPNCCQELRGFLTLICHPSAL